MSPVMLHHYKTAISGEVGNASPNLLVNMTKDIAGLFEGPVKKATSRFQDMGSKVLCSCRVEHMVH